MSCWSLCQQVLGENDPHINNLLTTLEGWADVVASLAARQRLLSEPLGGGEAPGVTWVARPGTATTHLYGLSEDPSHARANLQSI